VNKNRILSLGLTAALMASATACAGATSADTNASVEASSENESTTQVSESTSSKEVSEASDVSTEDASEGESKEMESTGSEELDDLLKQAVEAEESGDTDTASNLYSQVANAFYNGEGVDKDLEKAIYYYDLSGELGNGFAYFHIGEMYEKGELSEDGQPDYEMAKSYYEKAANASSPNCKGVRNIGQWYELGNTSLGQDYKTAAEYYEWAIEIDDASSCYYLGNLYEQGYITADGEPDYENAIKYYQMGYDKGNPNATGVAIGIYRLGYFYETGTGVDADIEKAGVYYQEAASVGNEDAIAACERLGLEIPEAKEQEHKGGDQGFVPGAMPVGGEGEGPSGEMGAFGVPDKSDDEALNGLISKYLDEFDEHTYEDGETSLQVPYRIYLPEDYDEEEEYPLVVFIGDSSTCGSDTTVSITQGYGALVWADMDEDVIVAVPTYPETILDDHGSYTRTEYVDLTARMIESIADEYAVDDNRIYGTGQSMGCMTMMITAAENPDLFAACMFVDGQWDVSELSGLAGQKFSYFAAIGDDRAYEGMQELIPVLKEGGSTVVSTEIDAKADQSEQESSAAKLIEEAADVYAITWTKGSTLDEDAAEGTSEHMYSFDYAYKLNTMCKWLLEQSK